MSIVDRTCIIHIGMHKTGTTSLQRTLNGISIPGWKYLNISGHISAIPFFAMFGRNAAEWHWYQKKGFTATDIENKGRQWREEFLRILNGLGEQNLVISGEAIPFIDEQGIVRLKEFIEPFFSVIKVVAYVRPPKGFLNSMLQQDIKAGATKLRLRPIQYRDRFEKFDRVFGKENVSLWKFEPNRFVNKCLVSDFCSRLNIPLPEGAVVRVNESLSREACGLLLAYRKYGRGYGVGSRAMKENNVIVDALYQVPGKKFWLADELIEPALKEYSEDIAWMEERLGEALAEGLNDVEQGIQSEDELLTISASICQQFAAAFEKLTGVNVSQHFPAEGNVEPRAAAHAIELCREDLRDSLNKSRQVDAQGQDSSQGKVSKSTAITIVEPRDVVSRLVDMPEFKAAGIGAPLVEQLVHETFRLLMETLLEQSKDGNKRHIHIPGLGSFKEKDAASNKRTSAGKRKFVFRTDR